MATLIWATRWPAPRRRAVVKKIMDRRVLDRVLAQGVRLQKALLDKFGEHPNVGDIRGRGLFFGLEFVRDRDSKKPFPPELRVQPEIQAKRLSTRV